MASFISTLLFLLLFHVAAVTIAAVSQPSEPSELMCYDWGESSEAVVSVLEGEVGWLSCPLFSHPSVDNYTSTQSTGHNLFWYRLPEGHDLEQPISYSSRLSRDRDRLWLQPATAADTGLYICMLRNKSSCSKIAMQLKVQRPDKAVSATGCPPVTTATRQVKIPFQTGEELNCSGVEEAVKMADGEISVSWYHLGRGSSLCERYPFWNSDREQKGSSLMINVMYVGYQGLYVCTVHYQRGGQTLNFTRSINVSGVLPQNLHKHPTILQLGLNKVIVRQDLEVHLLCQALFPYLDSAPDIWWTVDGKKLDQLSDRRFSQTNSLVNYDYGDRTVESELVIQNFKSEDLNREYNCSVKNERGFDTHRVQLEQEDLEVHLLCQALFPYLDSAPDIWWTVDGKKLDQLSDRRFSQTNSLENYDYGDRTVESELVIQDFKSEDLNREYNCSVKNERGFDTHRVQLEQEDLQLQPNISTSPSTDGVYKAKQQELWVLMGSSFTLSCSIEPQYPGGFFQLVSTSSNTAHNSTLPAVNHSAHFLFSAADHTHRGEYRCVYHIHVFFHNFSSKRSQPLHLIPSASVTELIFRLVVHLLGMIVLITALCCTSKASRNQKNTVIKD